MAGVSGMAVSLITCCGASMGVASTSGSVVAVASLLLPNAVHGDIKGREEDQGQQGGDHDVHRSMA